MYLSLLSSLTPRLRHSNLINAELQALRYYKPGQSKMAFQLFSTAFTDGGWIPELCSCQGADISPALEWKNEPNGTRSFVLIVDDPDAPGGTWNHWLLYDIPATIHNLPQGWKPGRLGVSGKNDFGKTGYAGPCPPKGLGPHRYYFRLAAVEIDSVGLKDGATQQQLDRAIDGKVLAEAR
jgi:Raf kinase inhibitor-like YbhB/YbcL family protein